MKAAKAVLSSAILACVLLPAPAQAQSVLPVEALPLSEWREIKTAGGPLGSTGLPPFLRRYAARYPYMVVYRLELSPRLELTFETEFPGDGIHGAVQLLGVDPQSSVDASPPAPSGTSYLILHDRDFPPRFDAQTIFGQRTYVTISPESRHRHAWILFYAEKAVTPVRVRVSAPPSLSKVETRRAGTYQRTPGQPEKVSFSNVYEAFWLGFRPGEEKTAPPDARPATPETGSPAGRTDKPIGPPVSPGSTATDLPEAGPQNSSAAVVTYPCQVKAFVNRGDYDTFRFSFRGGRLAVRSEGGLDLVADIFDSGGRSILRAGQGPERDFALEAEVAAGDYYLQVRVMRHEGEGPYRLILGDGSGPSYTEKGGAARN